MKDQIKDSIQKSVLCWLGTASKEGNPNVSPKEIFMEFNDTIIIANIASPNSVRNIRENNKVSLSFIDVLVQKGFQVKGQARVITSSDTAFEEMKKRLTSLTKGLFPFQEIIVIAIESTKIIIAPRYMFYPETTEEDQIKSARLQYGL